MAYSLHSQPAEAFMNPEPRQALVAPRSFEVPPAVSAHAPGDLRSDEIRIEKDRDLEPNWDELKDTATD
jgi:hypothetical protein